MRLGDGSASLVGPATPVGPLRCWIGFACWIREHFVAGPLRCWIKDETLPKSSSAAIHVPSAQRSILQQRSGLKSILLAVSLFLVLITQAQVVNIENSRIYDDTVGWSGEVTGLFSAQQNKDLLVSANFRPRVQYKTKKQSVFFIGDYLYSKGKDKVFANQGMLHFRHAYRIKQSPWKWETYTQIQYNELLDQRYRFLVGGGLRLKMYDKKGWKFFGGTSTFYEQEKYMSNNQIVEDVRWSNYLSWFIDPKSFFSFSGATYYQPLWEDFKDYRILGQYTLSFRITKQFSIKTNLNFFHDSRPQTDVRKTIYNTSVGFGYSFI